MTLKVMADNRVEISAKQDGGIYNVALGGNDFVVSGLGNEFAMTYTGRVVTVASGEAVLHGRHITADSSNQITLPQSQSGYLVLRIDLTQVSGSEAMLYATPTLKKEEINWNGNVYDLPLATFTTTATKITVFEDVRNIKASFYPLKVSELENDSNFAKRGYVDDKVNAVKNTVTKLNEATYTEFVKSSDSTVWGARKGNVISLYVDIKNLSTQYTDAIILTLPEEWRPKHSYVITPLLGRVSPYTPVASVWIYTNGDIHVVKPSSVTGGYAFITYVIDE